MMEEFRPFGSCLRSIPRLTSSYKAGDWKYQVTYETALKESEPYGISISYKGVLIVGKPGDILYSPWGFLKCNRFGKWFSPGWYSGMVIDDYNGKPDLTPIDHESVRPASHPTDEEILKDCITILRDYRNPQCGEVIEIIRRQGAKAAHAVPSLLYVLKKDLVFGLAPISLISCLGFIGTGAIEAVPTLLKLTEHDDTNVRSSLIWALFRIAPDSDDTKAYILKSCNDTSDRVRAAAVSAAGRLK